MATELQIRKSTQEVSQVCELELAYMLHFQEKALTFCVCEGGQIEAASLPIGRNSAFRLLACESQQEKRRQVIKEMPAVSFARDLCLLLTLLMIICCCFPPSV